MNVYDKLRREMFGIMKRLGQPIVLRRTDAMGTTTAYQSQGVLSKTITHALADSGVEIGDDVILLDSTVEPKPGDRISYNDQDRVVVGASIISPASIIIGYECRARIG